jgi:hypothetical protein
MPNIKKKMSATWGGLPAPNALDDRPKILFFGDPHSDFEPVIAAASDRR